MHRIKIILSWFLPNCLFEVYSYIAYIEIMKLQNVIHSLPLFWHMDEMLMDFDI